MIFVPIVSTATPPERKIDYQAAADHFHDADYGIHARRLMECLSDETGVGGKSYSYDPRTEFGKALTAPENAWATDKESLSVPRRIARRLKS